ncbi:16044_t:CDS:2, partial [Funneliformis geosporum]
MFLEKHKIQLRKVNSENEHNLASLSDYIFDQIGHLDIYEAFVKGVTNLFTENNTTLKEMFSGAAKDMPYPQYNLGDFYENGTNRDQEQAMFWYKKVAKNGSS